MTAPHDDERRRAELVTALGSVRARIADACAAADRDPNTVTLVAVTKTYPASDVVTLVQLGVHHIGESRDQEASAKVRDVQALLGDTPAPAWHFVGRLQSRKCRSVAAYASAVHSVDRSELVDKLARAIEANGRPPVEIFVQVSLDADPNRGGVPVDAVADLADAVAARQQLRLRGVMAVPPLGTDAEAGFARLAEISRAVRDQHPEADAISAGMSDDFEAAVKHGSTHVRVGTALLGRRRQIFS